MRRTDTQKIKKEEVSTLTFSQREVLKDDMDRRERMVALHRATSLGNLEKGKVLITFEDIEGLKQLYTTIWAVTDTKIVLKGGRFVPVHCIHSVQI